MKNTINIAELLEVVRREKPLVHHITNYVTVNDCANITLAIGASPIMADAIEEVADIAAISSAFVINIGTLNARTVESMIVGGKSANLKGIPVIFDPVGAGASSFRNEVTNRIIEEIKLSVVRGNISEIRYISGLTSSTKGVDASEDDADSDAISIAKNLAERLNCTVAITGAVDTISDGKSTILISNGNVRLSRLTGTGCMCTSLVASFCGASPNTILESTVAGILSMGIAGEIAVEILSKTENGNETIGNESIGNGSFHVSIIDAVSKLNSEIISEYSKIEIL